jgi:DNA-binding protein H-NS
MRVSRLERMSLKELTTLHARVQAAIDEKRVTARHQMRAKMERMARASGFSVVELFGGRTGRGRTVAPKYRNPKNPSQTWTGRGRRPNWLVRAGGDMKRFLIAS